jgi:RNA polymerase sigma-70 factor, ECF subfamily
VGTTPSQSVESPAQLPGQLPARFPVQPPLSPATETPPDAIDALLLDELWQQSDAAAIDLSLAEFSHALLQLGLKQNFAQPAGIIPSPSHREVFYRNLKLADLALARACAKGSERPWERFLALYQQPLTRAAIAICGSESQGRETADALYAELYGLKTRDGERKSPLDSYRGRGSLMGWLRATLAQRHVDHHRRSVREQPLDDALLETIDARTAVPSDQPAAGQLGRLGNAIVQAIETRDPEERFLLAAYFLDGSTLLQIAQTMRVHEATVSRRVHRLTADVRKQVLRNLEQSGLSRRAALEQLGADPRDLDLNLKKVLQYSQSSSFSEQPSSNSEEDAR